MAVAIVSEYTELAQSYMVHARMTFLSPLRNGADVSCEVKSVHRGFAIAQNLQRHLDEIQSGTRLEPCNLPFVICMVHLDAVGSAITMVEHHSEWNTGSEGG